MATDRTGLRARDSRTDPGEPTRMCVGCRGTDSWSALLRVVAERDGGPGGAPTGLLVPDPRHRLAGRGAWLHPTDTCLEQAVRRRAFGRALRVSVALDPEPVREHLSGSTAATQD